MQSVVIKSYDTKKSIVMPIIMLVIGILLFVNPGGVTKFLSYIFGGVFLALGIAKFVKDYSRNDKTTSDTFYSIIMMLIGIVFIVFSNTFEFLVRFVIGVWILLNGLNTIAMGSNLMRVDRKSILTLLIGFALVIIGLYMIFINNLVFSTIGIILIIYSCLEIIDYFYISAKGGNNVKVKVK